MDKHASIFEALRLSLSPSTSPFERTQAYSILTTFEKTENSSFAFSLLSSPSPFSHHHYALHCLLKWIHKDWNIWNSNTQTTFRNTVLSILSLPSQNNVILPKYLSEKWSSLLCEIAKRTFPQDWNTFFTDVFNICGVDINHAEIGLHAMKNVLVDCIGTEYCMDLSSRRRNEILKGFMERVPEVLARVCPFIKTTMMSFTTGTGTVSERVITSCLELMQVLMHWAPVKVVLNSECAEIVNAFIQTSNVNHHELQTLAISCWSGFFGRKMEMDQHIQCIHLSKTIFNLHVILHVTDYLHSVLYKLYEEIDEMQLSLYREYHTVLCTWGLHQLDFFEKDFELMKEWSLILLSFSTHPSLKVRSEQLNLWTFLLKHSYGKTWSNLSTFLLPMWTFLSTTCCKIGNPTVQDNNVYSLYSQLEFADEEEYKVFIGTVRNQVSSLIPQLLERNPGFGIQYVVEHVTSSMQKIVVRTTPVKVDDAVCIAFDGLMWFFPAVLRNARPYLNAPLPGSTILTALQTVVDQFISYSFPDPILLSKSLAIYASLFDFYTQDNALLLRVLEKLFGLLSSPENGVRQDSCHSLIGICKAVPTLMLPHFNTVYTHVGALVTASPPILTNSQVMNLFEALVLVSNVMPDATHQDALLQQILQTPLSQWQDPQLVKILSSPQTFVAGILEGPTSNGSPFFQLPHLMMTLRSILSRATKSPTASHHPATPYLPILLPQIGKLIALLHSLSSPALKPTLLSDTSTTFLLAITEEEMAIYSPEMVDKNNIKNLKKSEIILSKIVKDVRDGVYHFLSTLLWNPEVYTTSWPYMKACLVLCMSDLVHMEHRHLRAFLFMIVRKIIDHCPPESYEECIGGLLLPVLSHSLQRLSLCFAVQRMRTMIESGTTTDSTQYNTWLSETQVWQATMMNTTSTSFELTNDIFLADLAKCVLEILHCLLVHDGSIASEVYTTRRHYILITNENVALLTLRLLIGYLCWKNSMLALRALSVCDSVLSYTLQTPAFHPLLGREMFGTALAEILQHEDYLTKNDLFSIFSSLLEKIYTGLLFPTGNVPCVLPRELLLSIPGVPPSAVQNLETSLQDPNNHSKERRVVFKRFLEELTTTSEQQLRTRILDLPTQLVLTSRKMKNTSAENSVSLQDLSGDHMRNLFT